MATGNTSAVMAAHDSDIRWMLAARADDPAAFAELVTRYQARLVSILHHLTGEPEEAEDLAQEVFLRVYRTRHEYTPTAKFSTWLFTIARHVAFNSNRDRARRPARGTGASPTTAESGPWPTGQTAPSREPPPAERSQHLELAEAVRHALATLSERHRLVILLSKFEEMSYADIGTVLEISPQAVKSLVSRARDQLRLALMPYIDPPPSTG